MMRLTLLLSTFVVFVLAAAPQPAAAQGIAGGGFNPAALDEMVANMR
ncbi:MAG: hypothetical protein ACREDO_13760 [Methyloceanibacter sp.]